MVGLVIGTMRGFHAESFRPSARGCFLFWLRVHGSCLGLKNFMLGSSVGGLTVCGGFSMLGLGAERDHGVQNQEDH